MEWQEFFFFGHNQQNNSILGGAHELFIKSHTVKMFIIDHLCSYNHKNLCMGQMMSQHLGENGSEFDWKVRFFLDIWYFNSM